MKKLYEDRGMLKWQGLILAEHRDMINQMFHEEKNVKKKNLSEDFDEQELYDRIIYTSFQYKVPVSLEVNTFDKPIRGYGVVQSLQPVNGRLKLDDGSYCIKDIVSIKLDPEWE